MASCAPIRTIADPLYRLMQDRTIDGQLTQDAYHYDDANRPDTVNGVTYIWNNNGNLYGVDRIALKQGGEYGYFLGDALGSVRQLSVGGGAVTLAQSYDPYGNVVASAGNGASIYRYTGEVGDPSGLTYLRARYYAPTLGRFVQADTFALGIVTKQPVLRRS
jgi:RHS repeat-associated protein